MNVIKSIKFVALLCFLSAFSLVGGCANPHNNHANHNGFAGNIVAESPIYEVSGKSKRAAEAYRLKQQNLSRLLYSQGVSISLVGDKAQLSIPSYKLFNSQSANLSPKGYKLLQGVTAYIKYYSLVNLFINTYVGDSVADNLAWALSARQAQIVEDYIQSKNLDIRFIDSQGNGKENPVTNHTGLLGDHENSRVVFSWVFLSSRA